MDSKGISLDEFVHRKLQPIKVLVGMLNREMELNQGETIELRRSEVDDLLTTLELFIEDFDRVSNVTAKRMQSKSQFVKAEQKSKAASVKHVA